ncbi:uncharacterized protein LOC104066263 [Cuculus canorus]|nr:uncharacterized protein LOC104066263 [Cuculus canorus]
MQSTPSPVTPIHPLHTTPQNSPTVKLLLRHLQSRREIFSHQSGVGNDVNKATQAPPRPHLKGVTPYRNGKRRRKLKRRTHGNFPEAVEGLNCVFSPTRMPLGQVHDHPTRATAEMEQRRRLLLMVALLTAVPCSDTFEVTSPQNVVGVVNQDAILPCRVSSAKPLENVQVQWKKITGGRLEVIHTPGQLGGRQTLKYLGRTSLPRDGFATGNVSLTLKNVQPEDEGTYSCVVTSRDGSAATTTDLNVAGSGEIVFEVLGPKGQGLELACRSEGWFPEPTVQWVTQEEQKLSADTTVQQNSSRLFSVLSRVTVTQGQGEEVTCRILNPLMPTEKKTTLRLSSSVFPRQSPWFPSFWTVFTLFLVTTAVGAVRVYRGCRKTAMDTDDDLVESACGTLINELGGRSDPRHVEPINVDETPRPSELFKPFDRGRDTFVHYARRNSISEFQLSYVRVTSEPVDYYSGMKMSPVCDDEEHPYLGEEHPYLDEERPYLDEEHPYLDEEHPYLDEEHPYLGEEHPYLGEEHPYLGEEHPYLDEEHPYLDEEHPYLGVEHPYLDEEHPYLGEEHPYLDEEHPYLDEEHPYLDEEHPYLDEEHPYLDEEHPYLGEEHPYLDEEHPYLDEEHPYLGEEHPYLDEKHPYLDEEHPYLGEEHPYLDEKHPYLDEEHPYLDEKHPYLDEEHPYLDEEHPYLDEEHPYLDEKHPYLDEEHPYLDEEHPYLDEKHPYLGEEHPYLDEEHPYLDEEHHYLDEEHPYLLPARNIEKPEGQFIRSPHSSVVGVIGEGIILPCHVVAENIPEEFSVQWVFHEEPQEITVSRYDGRTKKEEQDEKYRGRAEFFRREFRAGNMSLHLKNVRSSDEGSYTCVVSFNGTNHDGLIELRVGATGAVPSIFLRSHMKEGIDLTCRTAGWLPKPEVVWLDGQGQVQKERSTTKVTKMPAGLYSVVTSMNLKAGSDVEVSCRIVNRLLNTTSESRILISAIFFPSISKWLIFFLVILCLSMVLIFAVISKVRSNRKKTIKTVKAKVELEEGRNKLKSMLEGDKSKNRAAKSKLKKRFGQLKAELEFWEARSHAVPITVNPECRVLQLRVPSAPDVESNASEPNVPSTVPVLVGKEGFEAGKHYWEVEVDQEQDWVLGVVREKRGEEEDGTIPGEDYWALHGSQGEIFSSGGDRRVGKQQQSNSVIGVLLDLEEGQVGFYGAGQMDILVRMTLKLGEELPGTFYPFLSRRDGTRSPLIHPVLIPVPLKSLQP